MDKLPNDVLIYTALMLDLPDILRLCQTNTRFNKRVCLNEQFWLNKIKRDYPDLQLYGKNYRQIYQNLWKGIVIGLIVNIKHQDKIRTFSYPLTINQNTIQNTGKFILYIISTFGDALWDKNLLEFTIYNESGKYKCQTEPWKYNDCMKNINYDTKEVVVNVYIDLEEYDMEYAIKNFDEIVYYVNDNFDKDTDKWPMLWM